MHQKEFKMIAFAFDTINWLPEALLCTKIVLSPWKKCFTGWMTVRWKCFNHRHLQHSLIAIRVRIYLTYNKPVYMITFHDTPATHIFACDSYSDYPSLLLFVLIVYICLYWYLQDFDLNLAATQINRIAFNSQYTSHLFLYFRVFTNLSPAWGMLDNSHKYLFL